MGYFRTNLFEYNDITRIKKSCEKNDVTMADNCKKVALVSTSAQNIFNVLDECFGKYIFTIENDVIFLNMDCDKK
jgi:hypothetical protein